MTARRGPARRKTLPRSLRRIVADLADRRRWVVWMPDPFFPLYHSAQSDTAGWKWASPEMLYKRRAYAVAIARVCRFKGARVAEVRVNGKGNLIKSSLPHFRSLSARSRK